MSFQWPGMLWALLLVPLALAAYVAAQRQRVRYAARFTNLDLLASVVSASPGWRRHVPPALYLLSLTLLLVSLARPETTVLVPKEQATVVLVMDVSGSMNATDVSPSRLAAAKEAGLTFLDELPENFKVGVVAFANVPMFLSRPTTDREAVRDALLLLRAEGGTAMGDGIELALEARAPASGSPPSTTAPPDPLDPDPPPTSPPQEPMLILLLSDGANTLGEVEPIDAAEHARQLAVPVFTVALGTEGGVVEVPDPAIGQLRRIPVPPDEPTLRRIAEITGGRFFKAPSRDDLKSIYRDLGSRIGFERERQEVTVVLAAAALLLLVAGGALALVWFSRFP